MIPHHDEHPWGSLQLSADAQMNMLRQAAWVARSVGRGSTVPLREQDVRAMADVLTEVRLSPGERLFDGGQPSAGVWIVRSGRVELSLGPALHRAVLGVLRPGDVDGDVALIADMPMLYTGHALEKSVVLFLAAADFERLIATHSAVARRWLTSIGHRLASSQMRILDLVGKPLPAQVAHTLLVEADHAQVSLPQRTLAAMLGVQRPSLNRILKTFEAAGLIAVGYRSIEIIDAAGLQAESQASA